LNGAPHIFDIAQDVPVYNYMKLLIFTALATSALFCTCVPVMAQKSNEPSASTSLPVPNLNGARVFVKYYLQIGGSVPTKSNSPSLLILFVDCVEQLVAKLRSQLKKLTGFEAKAIL